MTKYFKNAFKHNKHLSLTLLLTVVIVQFCSCVNYKKIPYFQNISSDTSTAVYKNGVLINAATAEELKIQPNDILNISIQTIDPELNDIMSTSKSTTPINVTGNNATIPGYLVDADGLIELPLAGKIKVGGLTIAQIKEAVRIKAMQFYKEPIVNVRLANFKVSVIGDVAKPGAYLINGEKASILDAISEAGDLTIYGQRDNVLLVRKEDGKRKMVRFDLTSTNIYQSPYFYLKQGDIIYIQPNKSKAASTDGAAVRTYAFITSTMSLIVILATRSY